MEPSNITTETTNTITTDPPTKPDHETPKTTNVGKITIPTPIGKTTLTHSSSTASSPDSPLVIDTFKIDDDDDDDKSVSSTNSSPSRKGSTIEAPRNQEMERPGYRIPSSVFARNESKADTDWSVASNESLFSIHEESGHPFWRSGELVATGCDEQVASTSTTDHMFSNYSAPHPKCAEVMKSRELGLLAVATMKEVILESETINQVDFEIPLAMASQCSRDSSTSTQSFAFSSKAGEGTQKDGLLRKQSSVRSIPEEQELYQPQTQVKAKTEAEAETRTEPQPAKNHDQKTDQAPIANTAHRRKWFPNFFSCCSL